LKQDELKAKFTLKGLHRSLQSKLSVLEGHMQTLKVFGDYAKC